MRIGEIEKKIIVYLFKRKEKTINKIISNTEKDREINRNIYESYRRALNTLQSKRIVRMKRKEGKRKYYQLTKEGEEYGSRFETQIVFGYVEILPLINALKNSGLINDFLHSNKEVLKLILVNNSHYTNEDLERLLEEVKSENKELFDTLLNKEQKEKLDCIKIFFSNRFTFKTMGLYSQTNNDIKVSKSLKYAPDYMIKALIFHEIIHIKFFNHGKKFKKYNRLYKEHDKAKLYSDILAKSFRYLGSKWIVDNII